MLPPPSLDVILFYSIISKKKEDINHLNKTLKTESDDTFDVIIAHRVLQAENLRDQTSTQNIKEMFPAELLRR